MEICRAEKTFNVLGKKYTGRFAEYPEIIPKAKADFKKEYESIFGESDFIRAIVYEPKRGPDHTAGYFYLGALMHEPLTQEVPENMHELRLHGEFATISEVFDTNRMGEFYNALDNWFIEHKQPLDHEHELIEVYHPGDAGQEQLEVFMKIRSQLNNNK